MLDIGKTRTSRYRPQSDGLVECMNRTLRQLLRASVNEHGNDWDDHLPYVMLAYRSTVQESTKCSPNLLMFGREVRLPVDLMYEGSPSECPSCPVEYVEWVRGVLGEVYSFVRDNMKVCAQRQKRLYDTKTQTRNFVRGEWVWVFYPPEAKEKFGKGWKGPYLILNRLGEVNYRVQKDQSSAPLTVHVDHIKSYGHDDTPELWITVNDSCRDVGVQANFD